MTSCCTMVPASSKSLFVIEPRGLTSVMSWETTEAGKGARQRNGRGVKKTPPIPEPEASHAPTQIGGDGKSSGMRTGRVGKESVIHRKSAKKAWVAELRRRRRPGPKGSERRPGEWRRAH